jgi:hypothetical protein
MKKHDWPSFLFFSGSGVAFVAACVGAWQPFAAGCVVAAFGYAIHSDK